MADLMTITRRLALKAVPFFAGTALLTDAPALANVPGPVAAPYIPPHAIFLRFTGHSVAVDQTATEILVGQSAVVCDIYGVLHLVDGPLQPMDASHVGRGVWIPAVDRGEMSTMSLGWAIVREGATLIGRVIATAPRGVA